ncbi:MAG: Na(+)-translocating NADH-quinone reductase subunit A [Thermoanaerobaculia bacterium]|nr:Na(+)-translocating NADH-quinone reductase subunit A [Thermoanaerobaculia bacterium]
MYKTQRGLRLPITGEPVQEIDRAASPRRVAILAADYVGMRPTMHVKVGDDVRRGQLLFEDKKTAGVRFTAPGAGRVAAVNRGERRAFQSLVIDLSRSEIEGRAGGPDEVSFKTYDSTPGSRLERDGVRELLLESGLWTALRARPFGRVADPSTVPHSIFVPATDSSPLSLDTAPVLVGEEERFQLGLTALGTLTDGSVFVCTDKDTKLPTPGDERIRVERFTGVHPSGTVGFHIHTLAPVNRQRTVWHLGFQDVIAIGHLFGTGKLHVDRVVALSGPAAKQPRLLRTRLGASLDELTEGESTAAETRVISGSVLSGRKASGEILGYLGRYDQQVSLLAEDHERHFLGWMAPGADTFSVTNLFLSRLIPGKKFAMTTTSHGSHRAIVPIGAYERVMAMDLMATPLLRSLLMHDVETAEKLGCLELGEEDVALCTFVDTGKNDFGRYLREVLNTIAKES